MRYGVQYVEAEALEFIFSKERRGMMPGYDYDEYRSINEITVNSLSLRLSNSLFVLFIFNHQISDQVFKR